MDEIEKAKGVIYGLAIGDALGWPTEFMSLDAIKTKYGERGIRDLPDPALSTDDTQMSIAIAEALIRSEEKYSMVDQMRRSSRSVCTNISEAWRKRKYKGAINVHKDGISRIINTTHEALRRKTL